MKSTTSRFSALNRRAEYLKLKSEKEKEKEKEKKEENNEEEEEEEEDDELEDKNKQNIQKPKNIPISKTPISSISTLNRLNDKQKISTTSQIPYNFTKSRLNYTQTNNNPELISKNPKDILIMRQGLHDKRFQIGGTPSAKNIMNKTKQTPNSPKGIKNNTILQNNPPQILKATYSQSNLSSNKVSIPGSKYSNIRRFGETITKQDENKNEIKIINKNNNYTINVTNNNNTITVNNNNIQSNNLDNFEKTNEKIDYNNINIEEKKEEEIKLEENKELNKKIKTKKEPRKDIKSNNYGFNISKENNNNNIKKEEKKEEQKINIQTEEEEEVEEEMNLTKKEKDTKRQEYVSNEQMIKNGIEIVKFSEEETNKVIKQKEENKEKKKNKMKKKEKEKEKKEKQKINSYYKDDNYINDNYKNKRETFIFHKRGANNFVKRGHYHYRTSHNDFNEYNDDDIYEHHRYNHFYERGRPNQIYKGSRGRRGGYRY